MGTFYLYLYRGGRDPFEHLVVLDSDVFERIWPHYEALDMAWTHKVPDDVQSLVDEAMGLPDADLRPSEMDAIPDDRFIRVTLC